MANAEHRAARPCTKVHCTGFGMTRYRHYKGGLYELVCEATQESDHTPMIVYRAHNGSLWTRPKAVFFEQIEVDGKTVQRFTEIDGVDECGEAGECGK